MTVVGSYDFDMIGGWVAAFPNNQLIIVDYDDMIKRMCICIPFHFIVGDRLTIFNELIVIVIIIIAIFII